MLQRCRRLLAILVFSALAAGACSRPEENAPREETQAAAFDLSMALTDPGSLDPPKITSNSATIIASQLCDTLVAFDPRTGVLKPGLAQSWTVAPDARKVTFQLRPGVKFHNGRDLVAEDFVYSLSRLANPTTASTQHFLLDKVVGYTETRAGRNPILTGVKAPAPQILEVELTQPFAEFPTILSNVVAGAAVPKEDVERSADEFAAGPVCTGPYQVDGAGSEDGIRLVRNDAYYGANGGFQNGGRGLATSLSFRYVESDADAYQLLADGDVDVSPVPPEDLAAAKQVEERVTSAPNGHVSYIGLPVKKAPFDNPNLRKALALSVDRRSIISGLLGNSRQAPGGFLPSSVGPGADAGRCADLAAEAADTDAAKAAIAQPGVTVPQEMNVYLNTGGGHEQWLETVLEQWNEDLGIRGVLKPADWDPYIDFLSGTGADGPFRLAWSVNFPSPEALFAPLFSSSSLDNYSRYSSQEFDAAMNKARATVGDTERMAAYVDAGRILCGDLPIIPIWFGLDHLAFADGLTTGGAPRLDIFGDPILRELRPS